MEKVNQLNKMDIAELANFFDLLARFDFEDKRKEALETGSSSVIATDGVPVSNASLIKCEVQK